MSRTDYGAILSTVIKDTSDAIREAKGTSALISPSDWGSEIRSIVPPWRAKVNSLIERTYTSIESDVTSVGNYTFYQNTLLQSVSMPSATTVGTGAFYGCSSLTSINLPLVTIVEGSAFNSCSSLPSIDLPLATSLGTGAFTSCSGLTSLVFPSVTSVGFFAFYQCPNLTSLDFLKQISIGNMCFSGCSKLDTLILRANAVTTIPNVDIFSNTPFASGGTGGTLYVPQALISSYRSASNWSTILGYTNNKILSIESMENN